MPTNTGKNGKIPSKGEDEMGGVRMGINVDIKRSDGRIHSAVVSGINVETKSVTVKWFERGETKVKVIELDQILGLNQDLAPSNYENANVIPNKLQKGARIWVKDPERVWKPARLTSDYTGGQLEIQDDEGESSVIKIKSEETDLPPLRNPDILIGENDLTSLSYLHEPAVLHNLTVRFVEREQIYTYCGIVLVAINPYKALDIYDNDTIFAYRGQNMGDLDPHIYAVSEEAFKLMERDNVDQSIIVSGESGAGKTVSAKFAMRYFATVGGTSDTETQVEKRVLASSPIMEAIGNAKTTRNDNSSRFGKYIEIDFNKSFHIIGASMRTYLLEKSRIVFQVTEERNYHIFYQMCAARDLPELEGFGMDHQDNFHYTNQGDNPEIDNMDDLEEFHKTIESFRLLGFSEANIKNVFRILASVLHLGNVTIKAVGRGDNEKCDVDPDDSALAIMADLLSVPKDQMRQWLTHRKISTMRETYVKPMNLVEANQAKDALAKCIYSNLFDWIVFHINAALKTTAKVNKFIGVLDIYGFESFEVNSFEQFCINYANEKLQQLFNQHVFKLEQEEYLKEGIEWKMIDFYDNQPCIDLIESKLGVLDLLDEECRMPKGSDRSWIEKLYDKCKKWEHFQKPRLSQTAFLVTHFADKVEYECDGFLHKNRDTVMEEQLAVLKGSDNDLVCDLFTEMGQQTLGAPTSNAPKKTPTKPQGGAAQKKGNKKTVGSQFRDSLNLLNNNLKATNPHYVRCIKPNDQKAAFVLDATRGVQQLRACGVLETVRISAAGYPSRWTYYDFYVRYRVLCHSKDIRHDDYKRTCENIVAKLIQDEDKYQYGKNKIFFRAGQVAFMEKLRSDKLKACGIMIQKNVKMWLYRKRYLNKTRATATLQRLARGFIARRRVRHMRRTSAATKLQARIRGWVQLRKYQRQRQLAISLQARVRGYFARKRLEELWRNAAAKKIQKVEELQKSSSGRIAELEAELKLVKEELQAEKEEKVDLVTEKVRGEEEWSKKEGEMMEMTKKLQLQLEEANNAAEARGSVDPEQLARLEEQKSAIHSEYEQERIAYQKLLKDFNRMEQQNENLRDEVSMLRGEKNRNISNASLSSSMMDHDGEFLRVGEEESAYGSVSGRSSLVSTLDRKERDRALESMTASEGGGPPDIALLMKLQAALNESTREKNALEKKLEELECGLQQQAKQTSDMLKLQQLEVENAKLREDMTRLRKSIAESGDQDNTAFREISDQYESLQEELDRKQAECIQLRTVLANVQLEAPGSLVTNNNEGPEPDAEELLMAYETQKNVIQQLQSSLAQERERANQIEKELRSDLDKLGTLSRDQQSLIQTNLNRSPTNQTEACMQHELTRLTGENFDLREKIENLHDTIKRLQRQLKVYMKKVADMGDSHLNEDSMMVDVSEVTSDQDQTLPAILKKDADYLGMLEYNKEQEEKLLRVIITDLKPRVASLMLPGMPAYVVFMLIRHLDHINDDKNVRSLIQGGISHVKKVIKKRGQTDIEMKSLWLSNTLRLLHCLKQYSGENQFQAESSPKQIEHCLRNFDLSAYRRVLSDIAVWIYQGITKVIEEEIQTYIVVAILEHEGIGGLSGDKPRPMRGRAGSTGNDLDNPTHVDPKEALDRLLVCFTKFHDVLKKHGLDPEIISQIFRQIFYFVCAGSLNNLLLRKDMCHWSRGMQIRYNVAQLEQWARDQKIEDTGNKVIDTLLPIIQATQLLQARKQEEDVTGICDMCDKLRVSQIIKILNLYTPADEFEERVSPAFVRKIQTRLSERSVEEAKNQVTLLMDTKFSFAVRFPFNPSKICFSELEIPEQYQGLGALVRKV